MSVPYVIGFAFLFVLQLVFNFVFLKVEIPKPSVKSLVLKLICSLLFIINVLFAMHSSENFSKYAIFIFAGLCFSLLGDGVLHSIRQSENQFIAGILCFLVGHVFYIAAFLRAQEEFFPDAPFLNIFETVVLITGICLSQFVLNARKAQYGKAFLPCTVYTNVITIMLVKALSLSLRLMSAFSVERTGTMGFILVLGASLFTLSDFTLALLRFTDRYSKSYFARKVNILAYYFAQMFLGLTVLDMAV